MIEHERNKVAQARTRPAQADTDLVTPPFLNAYVDSDCDGSLMNIPDLQRNARRASTLLKAMSNERRLLILCFLAEGEKSVGELEELVDLSQSALSQHLARLRRDKLVRTRRSAQNIYYSLNGHEAQTVMATLHDLFCAPTARKDDGPATTEETSGAPAS